jgi:hypothetical protein
MGRWGGSPYAPEGHAAASHMIALSLLKQHAVTSLVPPSFRHLLAPRCIFRWGPLAYGRIRKGVARSPCRLVRAAQKLNLSPKSQVTVTAVEGWDTKSKKIPSCFIRNLLISLDRFSSAIEGEGTRREACPQ